MTREQYESHITFLRSVVVDCYGYFKDKEGQNDLNSIQFFVMLLFERIKKATLILKLMAHKDFIEEDRDDLEFSVGLTMRALMTDIIITSDLFRKLNPSLLAMIVEPDSQKKDTLYRVFYAKAVELVQAILADHVHTTFDAIEKAKSREFVSQDFVDHMYQKFNEEYPFLVEVPGTTSTERPTVLRPSGRINISNMANDLYNGQLVIGPSQTEGESRILNYKILYPLYLDWIVYSKYDHLSTFYHYFTEQFSSDLRTGVVGEFVLVLTEQCRSILQFMNFMSGDVRDRPDSEFCISKIEEISERLRLITQ